jgi:hypothetical protein
MRCAFCLKPLMPFGQRIRDQAAEYFLRQRYILLINPTALSQAADFFNAYVVATSSSFLFV